MLGCRWVHSKCSINARAATEARNGAYVNSMSMEVRAPPGPSCLLVLASALPFVLAPGGQLTPAHSFLGQTDLRAAFLPQSRGALLNQVGSSREESARRASAVRKPRGKKLVRGMHLFFFWQNSTGADCSGPKAMGKKKKKPFAAAIDNLSLFTWWVQN